jgi:hypothetical protein
VCAIPDDDGGVRLRPLSFFTAENYRVLLQLNMAFQTAYLRYTQGALSLQDMIAATEVRFTSSLRTRDEVTHPLFRRN